MSRNQVEYRNISLEEAARSGPPAELDFRNREVEIMLPLIEGGSTKFRIPVFKYKILNNNEKGTTIIQIFPSNQVNGDVGMLERMGESLKRVIIKYLDPIGAIGRWVDPMSSFCITFPKSVDSVDLAKLVVEEFENDLRNQPA